MKLLIVEDEQAIAALMKMHLERLGYECCVAADGEEGADKLEEHDFDLVLLDIMLPKVNGYELMAYIEPLKIPVIFITAKGSVQDRVRGLHMGADDYLVKPFALDELAARVESVLRRYHKNLRKLQILDITIDMAARFVTQNGKEIILTPKEYELLLFLIQNKNIALYRDILYQKIWEEDCGDHTRTLDLHIQRLRKKLQWQEHIKTIYKIGYMLEVPDEVC